MEMRNIPKLSAKQFGPGTLPSTGETTIDAFNRRLNESGDASSVALYEEAMHELIVRTVKKKDFYEEFDKFKMVAKELELYTPFFKEKINRPVVAKDVVTSGSVGDSTDNHATKKLLNAIETDVVAVINARLLEYEERLNVISNLIDVERAKLGAIDRIREQIQDNPKLSPSEILINILKSQ